MIAWRPAWTRLRRLVVGLAALLVLVPHAAAAQADSDTVRKAAASVQPKPVDRAFAWALGVAIPGAGHVYAGETTRGLLFGAAAIAGGVVAFHGAEGATSEAGALVWIGAWGASLFDLPRALAHHDDRPVVALGAAHHSLVVAISLRCP